MRKIMNIHSENIISYIEYLKSVGYTVTLHGMLINDSVFKEYNYHQNPYCHFVKTVYGKWEECICHQKKVIEKATKGSYFGCCYAGVGEYVYPIKVKDKINGFISVSGYKSDLTTDKSRNFALKHTLSYEEIKLLAQKYLKDDIPQKKVVDAVVEPLAFMIEAYFERQSENCGEDVRIYHKVLRFVTENCHSRITMKQLSEHFNYSVSTLSHMFLKNSGKSLPEYIDDLRLNESKWYLANSNISIMEIASFLGYSSSNYFSSNFKLKQGVTPREYRQSAKQSKEK